MSEPVPTSSGPQINKLIMAAGMFVAFLFVLIGTPLPVITADNEPAGKILVSIWEVAIENPTVKQWTVIKLKDYPCGDLADRGEAAQGFAILSVIAAFACFMFAVLDAVEKCPLVNMGFELVSVIAGAVAFVLMVIQYALVANIWDHGFCGAAALKDSLPVAKLGSGVFLYVVASVVTLASIILKIVLKKK